MKEKMKRFDDLQLGHFYIFKMTEPKDLPHPWIAEVTELTKTNAGFRDIFDFGGHDLDDDYQYHRDQFGHSIYIMKEITKKKNPEYFV